MHARHADNRSGFTLIDLILSIGMVVLLFGGVYLVYFSILDMITSTQLRTAAAGVLERQIEMIRNLPYSQVGTVNGIPNGVIPPVQAITQGDIQFSIDTTIRNIDDPLDGTVNGSPQDNAPSDYKLIEMEVSCANCQRFIPLRFTTTVSPKSLESASGGGALFVRVFDANGLPVPDATVRVTNAAVTPTIDLTDTTNASGVLQLVDVPTSTQGYAITVSKTGYSTDKTYPPGAVGNPNPILPHATVVEGLVTTVSFTIDRTSTVNVRTHDVVCTAVPAMDFTMRGEKLIGTPDVYKFSTSSATDANGVRALSGIEWDAYSMTFTEAAYDIVGTIPVLPLVVNPSSTADFSFVLQPTDPQAFLVTVQDDATGIGIPGATVTLSRSGFSETRTTGRATVTHTDWSGGQYASQDGGIDVDSAPGSLRMESVDGLYSTSTESWIISNTIDTGGNTSQFYSIAWTPTSQPGQTGTESVRFQVASNNDNTSWVFIGPDGTGNSFYTTSGTTLHPIHTNNRYLRYKVYMKTADENTTPTVTSVSFEFSGVCVPQAHALFTSLTNATYNLDVQAPGYLQATSTIVISGAWQQTTVGLDQP